MSIAKTAFLMEVGVRLKGVTPSFEALLDMISDSCKGIDIYVKMYV